MNGINGIGLSVCCVCVAVGILSVLVPQKRTRRIMSFVIGVFFICAVVTAFSVQVKEIELPALTEHVELPTYSEKDYNDAVAQMTADNLRDALNDLLMNEGIAVNDLQLTLKISDKGRISVERAVIYISETDQARKQDIENIIYRNISKEPEIYVTGQKVQRMAE